MSENRLFQERPSRRHAANHENAVNAIKTASVARRLREPQKRGIESARNGEDLPPWTDRPLWIQRTTCTTRCALSKHGPAGCAAAISLNISSWKGF